jgi:hypothetical protein
LSFGVRDWACPHEQSSSGHAVRWYRRSAVAQACDQSQRLPSCHHFGTEIQIGSNGGGLKRVSISGAISAGILLGFFPLAGG